MVVWSPAWSRSFFQPKASLPFGMAKGKTPTLPYTSPKWPWTASSCDDSVTPSHACDRVEENGNAVLSGSSPPGFAERNTAVRVGNSPHPEGAYDNAHLGGHADADSEVGMPRRGIRVGLPVQRTSLVEASARPPYPMTADRKMPVSLCPRRTTTPPARDGRGVRHCRRRSRARGARP
jgi:hypothetical protein